jgi:hypothetical protein
MWAVAPKEKKSAYKAVINDSLDSCIYMKSRRAQLVVASPGGLSWPTFSVQKIGFVCVRCHKDIYITDFVR